MLALLFAANSLAASGSSTSLSVPDTASRAVVGRSLIRSADASGSRTSDAPGDWSRIGLQGHVSAGSAVPQPGLQVLRQPERGFPGLTNAGPTGLLLVPSSRVLRSGWWAAGLHRGVIKAGVGILGIAETGASAPDIYEPLNSRDWGSRSSFFLKLSTELLEHLGRLADGSAPPWRMLVPVLAAGLENSPNRDAETAYGAAGWDLDIEGFQADVYAGWGTGRFAHEAFFGAGIVPSFLLGSTFKLTGEYAGRQGISGIRFAISRTLRLDFAMRYVVVPRADPRGGWSITTDGVTLGVSQSGPLRLADFFKRLFKSRQDATPKA